MFDELDLILLNKAFDGPMQMALDEVLLRSVLRPTLRIYAWGAACVTFGYFQKVAEVRQTHPEIPLVRRWTGGGMVEHGNDLTFSLMVPKGDPVSALPPAHFYKKLHARVAGWLNSAMATTVPAGIPAVRLAGVGDLLTGPSCFSAPAPDDLLMGGNKILGGAQRRSNSALMYQGSLQGVGHLGSLLDPVGLSQSLGGTVSNAEVRPSIEREAADLAKVRYSSVEWNERR
jgi:lipoate-protein ligase A